MYVRPVGAGAQTVHTHTLVVDVVQAHRGATAKAARCPAASGRRPRRRLLRGGNAGIIIIIIGAGAGAPRTGVAREGRRLAGAGAEAEAGVEAGRGAPAAAHVDAADVISAP